MKDIPIPIAQQMSWFALFLVFKEVCQNEDSCLNHATLVMRNVLGVNQQRPANKVSNKP